MKCLKPNFMTLQEMIYIFYSLTVCTFDKCAYIREFGFEGPHIVGWIEKDGRNGATSEEEVVRMDDKVEAGVIIHVACTTW